MVLETRSFFRSLGLLFRLIGGVSFLLLCIAMCLLALGSVFEGWLL